MRNKNECNILTLEKEKIFVKKFKEKKRYESEIFYNNFFKEKGFLTTDIIKVDEINKEIYIKYIIGEKPKSDNLEELFLVIDTIEKIAFSFSKTGTFEQKISYCKKIKNEINLYINERNIVVPTEIFEEIISLIYFFYLETIFKDSKLDNWLISGNDVFMLDFDYVVNSHFLSDFSQFINYVEIDIENNEKIVIILIDKVYFIFKKIFSEIKYNDFLKIFYFLKIYSIIKSNLYNDDENSKQKKEKQLLFNINKLKCFFE